MRSAIIAFTTVAMLIAVTFGVSDVEAGNTLSLDVSDTEVVVMEGSSVWVTLTITNSDTRYRSMETQLYATWIGGSGWTTKFFDVDEFELEDDIIFIGKEDPETVKLQIKCDGACKAGEEKTLSIYAISDPKWYNGGTDSGTTSGCQPDCSDTTPASSGNATTAKQIKVTTKTGEAHTVDCDDNSNSGTKEMFQSTTYQWGYDLENTGFNDDTYTFETSVNSGDGGSVVDWTISSGLSSKALTGTNDATATAVHKAEASMTIKPAATARPGSYTIGLVATSTNSGNTEGCTFNVVIPEPDLEVLDTDITFSHSSAWINSRGDSQRVTIFTKVRNNGGTVDSQGVTVTDVNVIFLVDGSQLGSVQTISSLGYGEEVTLQAYWNPGRAHDGDEVGIPVKVSVDPSVTIQETEADNNIGSKYFKVVKTKASNPSFYMSFLSLIGAVGAAVLMSTYYRNKDSEE